MVFTKFFFRSSLKCMDGEIVYLLPLVVDFPHSLFLVPEIFGRPILSREIKRPCSAVPFTNESAIFCEFFM